MSKRVGSIVLLLVVGLLLVLGYRYIHYRIVNAVSDAAFIKSDRLPFLSFKVGGKVVEMKVEANRPVKKGELLARIDATDFRLARQRMLHQRRSLGEKIAAARLKKKRLRETLALQSRIAATDVAGLADELKATRLQIDAARTRLEKLEKDKARFARMLSQNLIAEAAYEQVQTEADSLAQQIDAMVQRLEALKTKAKKAKLAHELREVNRREIAELDKSIDAMLQKRKALDAAVKETEKKIAYTRLTAPFDGVIAKKFFDAPKVVVKGYPVYALTDPKKLYCEVLLSEKKMKGVRPGNPVIVEVDALQGKTFHGKVQSIAPTSASTFSLVPRDIASGEFTKLDQRFIVRISLDSIEGLRAGMGATVAISRSAGESLATGH